MSCSTSSTAVTAAQAVDEALGVLEAFGGMPKAWTRGERQRRRHTARRKRRVELARRLGRHSGIEWLWLLTLCGRTCLGCRRTGVPLAKDHVVPVSLGGSDAITNLQPLCLACNSAKGASVADYRSETIRRAIRAALAEA